MTSAERGAVKPPRLVTGLQDLNEQRSVNPDQSRLANDFTLKVECLDTFLDIANGCDHLAEGSTFDRNLEGE